MAGTANDARLKAKSWAGLVEGPPVDKAIMNPYCKVTGRKGLKSKLVAWCMIMCIMALILSGVPSSKVYKSSGCTQQLKWFKKKKRFKARGVTPKVGWIVFYNFKNSKTTISTHAGIVTSVNYKKKGYMYVCEGNKKLKNGKDGVGYRHINFKSKYIVGFGIPYYK